jgi:hypothetical protein
MSISPNSPNRPWVVSYGHSYTFTYFIPPGTMATAAVIERIGTITSSGGGIFGGNYKERLTIGGSTQDLATIVANGEVDDAMSLNSAQLAALNAVGVSGGNLTVTFDCTTTVSGSPNGVDTLVNLFLTFAATVAPVPTLSPTPAFHGGAPGGDGASGLSTNPYALTGTQITEIGTDARALSARVHRQAKTQYNQVELWRLDRSNGDWYLFPVQPVMSQQDGPRLTRRYQAPTTLDFFLPDDAGALTPESLNSAYNYNQAGAYDPLLDEARQVLLRVGCLNYGNLAAGIAPTFATDGTAMAAGSLALLTDGVLTNYAAGLANAVTVATGSSTYGSFTVDLGSVQMVRHAAARCGSRAGTTVLPLALTLSLSSDNVTYNPLAARPIGGAGDGAHAPGDWDENPDGIAVETAVTDIDRPARYVQFRFDLPPSGGIAVDEIAVYGGAGTALLGRNWFVGYLGDATDIDSLGLVSCTATDVKKRLADNNSVTLTAAYEQNNTGAVELADIAYSLLTSTAYWTGAAGSYNAPFGSSFIGWTSGTNYTGFQFPLWQGQTNSMLGYVEELWHDIGWAFYADGNGVLQAREPAYSQQAPDRVLTAASLTGNGDLRDVQRQRTGKNIRNKIRVTSGTATDIGSGLTQVFDPNSTARYGERMMVIADPILITRQLREKMAQSVLRDYSTRSQELTATIQPDFDTQLRAVHGLRAQGRTSLYGKASGLSGAKRLRELWQLNELTEIISISDWSATARYIPYVPQTVQAPSLNSIDAGTAGGGGTAAVTLHWDPILDPKVASINIYASATGEAGPYSLSANVTSSPNAASLTLSTATTFWFYLTAVDPYGVESFPSAVLSVFPGSGGDSSSDYYVGDLAVSFIGQSGPDVQGAWTYHFYATWTSPNTADGRGGFCQSYTHADTRDPRSAFDGLNPYLYQIGVAHWWAQNRIPPGKTWDRVTGGILDASWQFRVRQNLSGVTLYFRMFTSTRTLDFTPSHPPCLGSNVVAVSIP